MCLVYSGRDLQKLFANNFASMTAGHRSGIGLGNLALNFFWVTSDEAKWLGP